MGRAEERHTRWGRRSSLAGALTLVFWLAWLGGCAFGPAPADPNSEAGSPGPPPLLGLVSQSEILSLDPDWIDELVRSEPDPNESLRLAAGAGGKEVVVYLGTWCSDSRRELTRFWRAAELAGGDLGFPIRYIGVDRNKAEPHSLLEGVDLRYVPTFLVLADGVEVGRIVESSPNGIEADLANLLDGTVTGWLSARDDLEAAPAGELRR